MRILSLICIIALAASSQAKLSNNIVSQWVNETQAQVATVGIQNQLSARYYATVALAIHQALAAGGAPPAALAAFAGHTVLSNLFPWIQHKYDNLIAAQLSGVSEADRKAAQGVAVPIAVKLLKDRTGGVDTSWAQFKPAAPGTLFAYQWTPGQKYALYPQLAQAQPFFLSTQEANTIALNKDSARGPVFRAPRADEYEATFRLGAKNSTERIKYDRDSAFFWADGANTSAITGHFLDIAREVLPDLSLEDTALFFARATAAAYDASITGWKVKYSTLAWRPVNAFRLGHPGAKAVPDWEPLLPTPPHPEYPSGHQVSVGAITEVIAKALGGKDDVTFTISSEGTPWLRRTYKSVTAAANEVGDSRLYAGLHFNSSNTDGLKLGRLVGAKVFDLIQPITAKKSAAATAAPTTQPDKKAAGRRLLAWVARHF